ncbi:hypothetical protein AA313_de0200426 [Arthrobotrys entomopaga]|nr:hypothetical protein AA313_de0200426 [Arthrobotrys entomopaga]
MDNLHDSSLQHQAFLDVVNFKHFIFDQFSLTAPVATVYRHWEGAADSFTFAFAIVGVVTENKASGISSDQAELDTYLNWKHN